MKRFDRVDLQRELRANSDGMPVIRKCFDHETLMSFYDDDGNKAFVAWWNTIGAIQFNTWLKKSDEFNHVHEPEPEPIKVECKCPCHSGRNIKHVAPCCNDGYIELPRSLITK